jgi:molecular chaperone GrpE
MTHRMSHRTRAEERIDEIDVSPTKLLEEIERLKAELASAQDRADENLATLQRTAADFQNYRRRTSEERERDAGLASEYLLLKVLALADDFDRAIEAMPAELAGNSWIEGVAAIDRKLRILLESEGIRVLEAVGRTFDPREHEAIANVPGTGRPEGEVVAEIQRGYRLRDRVLRPALVAVAGGSAPAPDGEDGDRRSDGTDGPAGPGTSGPGPIDDPND